MIKYTSKVDHNNVFLLLVVQVCIRLEFIPLVYFSLSRKNTLNYNSFFTILKNEFNAKPLENIIIDLEDALFTSLSSLFTNNKLKGYFFHLSQFFWEKDTILCKITQYKTHADF